MAFPALFLDELVERSDIAEVVSDYVQLKQRGTTMFGLCPFHSEKTASFAVSKDKQIYHCFGCGAGGGVINFIMQAENLDFPDAVRFLAARAGMSVPEDGDAESSRRRARLIEINKAAARYFHAALMDDRGTAARKYFKDRGITEKTVRKFGLGFAPDGWSGLIDSMRDYEKSDLLDAGLAVKNKSGGIYDRFRNRVIFPIIDVRGSVIGFGGRVLDDSLPKYLNSPETMIYNKSRNLFALNIAKKTKQEYIILAEGYMDVIALHQAGFDSAVASLGTSLTEQQARLIAKYAKTAVIAYDSDTAGKTAAERAISILEKTGIQVKVLSLPGAKDPDEYIKKFGAESLKLRLERSDNHVEYRLGEIRAKYDISDDEQKVLYLKEAAALLGEIESAIERTVYAAKVAEQGGVPASVVESEAALEAKKLRGKRRQKENRETLRPVAALQPKLKEQRYTNIRSAVAEQGLIRCLIADDSLINKARENISPDDFSSGLLSKIYSSILNIEGGQRLSVPMLAQYLEPEEMSHLVGFISKEGADGDISAMMEYIDIIKQEADKRELGDEGLMAQWERLQKTKRMKG